MMMLLMMMMIHPHHHHHHRHHPHLHHSVFLMTEGRKQDGFFSISDIIDSTDRWRESIATYIPNMTG